MAASAQDLVQYFSLQLDDEAERCVMIAIDDV
jgi:hypothetical protein